MTTDTARLGFTAGKPHNKWEQFVTNGCIAVPPLPLLSRDDKVFTIGSCFANNIRHSLQHAGITCVPNYLKLEIDPATMRFEGQMQAEHMSYFNSFTILQEFERAAGLWEQAANDYWQCAKGSPFAPDPVYQDPYRRLLGASSAEALYELNRRINIMVREGFQQATVFFITYGMAEVFRQKSNGRVAGQKPLYFGGGGLEETTLHISSFAENYANMARTVDIIRQHRPDAKIVMSISPIPLSRTFSENDVAVASMEGKSVLRAAVGEIVRAYPDVLYFPAYELITYDRMNAFEVDGRHVHWDYVHKIIEFFTATYLKPEQVEAEQPQSKPDFRNILNFS